YWCCVGRAQLHDGILLAMGQRHGPPSGAAGGRRCARGGGGAWRSGSMSGQHKTVLVTGAAKRIGRGIALGLHAAGYRVAIHYHHSEAEARATARECGQAELFRANLENVPDIERMFGELADRCGRLDALVNNAARFTRFDPLQVTEKDWDFIHNVNLK